MRRSSRSRANGRAAVLIEREGAPYALLTVDASCRGIDRSFGVMSPDKLTAIVRSSRPTKR
jgi:RNA polymerase sigma-70 factor (ECF subfamily)